MKPAVFLLAGSCGRFSCGKGGRAPCPSLAGQSLQAIQILLAKDAAFQRTADAPLVLAGMGGVNMAAAGCREGGQAGLPQTSSEGCWKAPRPKRGASAPLLGRTTGTLPAEAAASCPNLAPWPAWLRCRIRRLPE